MASRTRKPPESGWWNIRRAFWLLIVTIFGGLLLTSYLNVYHAMAYAQFWTTVDMTVYSIIGIVFSPTLGPILVGIGVVVLMLMIVGGALLALWHVYTAVRKHAL